MERAALISDGTAISLEDLRIRSPKVKAASPEAGHRILPPCTLQGVDLPNLISTIEKQYIEDALALTGGNESKAAKLLGISRDTIRYRRKKLEHDPS
jgi:two-component system, NtrC family, response regulator AtoC